jgi:DNA-binding PadR family transcriptional regulator
MRRNRPPSAQTTLVLLALAEDPAAWRHGYDLCQQTGLKAGTLYPILIRLADRGWLETQWESAIPAGRPARHLYRLSETGLEQVNGLEVARPAIARAKNTRPPRLREARWTGPL